MRIAPRRTRGRHPALRACTSRWGGEPDRDEPRAGRGARQALRWERRNEEANGYSSPRSANDTTPDLGHPAVLEDREDVPVDDRSAHGLGAVGHAVFGQPAPGVLAEGLRLGQAALLALLFLGG